MHAGPQERRLLNQAFFARIKGYEHNVEIELAELFRTLFSEELPTAAHAAASLAPAPELSDNQP